MTDKQRTKQFKEYYQSVYNGKYSNYSSNVENAMADAFAKYGDTEYWNEFASIPTLRAPAWMTPSRISSRNYSYYTDFFDAYEKSSLNDIAQIIQTIREEKRSDPSSSVARERAAGLNPDLLQNVGPGEVAEFDNAANQFDIPSLTNYRNLSIQNAQGRLQLVHDALGSAFNMVSAIQGITGQSMQNTSVGISNLESFDRLVLDEVAGSMPTPKFDDNGNLITSYEEFEDLALKSANRLASSYKSDVASLPAPLRKGFKRAFRLWSIDAKTNSLPIATKSKIEKLYKDYAEDKLASSKVFASPAWNDNDAKMVKEYFNQYADIEKQVWDLQQWFLMSDYSVKGTSNNVQSAVYEKMAENGQMDQYVDAASRLPASDASTRIDTNATLKKQNEFARSSVDNAKKIEDVISDINSRFDKLDKTLEKSDSFLAPILRTFLPMIQQRIITEIRDNISTPFSARLGDALKVASML